MSIAVPGYERKSQDNPFNYTEDELIEKKLALKTMMELYPDVGYYHAEWVYDLCKNKKQEEINKMKQRIDKNPSKFKAEPKSFYTMNVIDPSQSLENKQE